jgi:TolB-like protein/methylphosphotriester-DNA--protein-cysteine methyltransferase
MRRQPRKATAAQTGQREAQGEGPAPTVPATAVPGDIRHAIEFLRIHQSEKITLADLARASGVAERTLHKHFRTFLGPSPLGYLRRMRLAAVRDELLSAIGHAGITEAATRHGFNHFGRFSTQYRRCFGETPSATLRRRLAAIARMTTEPESNISSVPPDGSVERIRSLHPAREKPSIVVLQFRTDGRDLRFFTESLADGLCCALAQIRWLSTKMASSLPSAAQTNLREAARQRNARYCITGRMIDSGQRLRVIVQLLDTATDTHLWGDSFDGEPANAFELQDRITEGVLRAILPNIRNAEIERARHKPPEDSTAYELAMRALPLAFAASPDAAREALDLLENAMRIDPDDAAPAALAAWCHAQLITYNGTRSVAEEKACALRLADRAGVLDVEGDPLVLTARCAVHTMMNDLETGAALLDRALARDPTSAWAWERSGWLKTYLGQPELAIRHFERAISLATAHPRNAHRFIGIGSAYFDAGNYEEAARWKRRAVLEQSGTVWVNRTLAVSYAHLGERLAALDALDVLRRSCPDLTISQVVSAVPFPSGFLDRVAEGLNDLGLPL